MTSFYCVQKILTLALISVIASVSFSLNNPPSHLPTILNDSKLFLMLYAKVALILTGRVIHVLSLWLSNWQVFISEDWYYNNIPNQFHDTRCNFSEFVVVFTCYCQLAVFHSYLCRWLLSTIFTNRLNQKSLLGIKCKTFFVLPVIMSLYPLNYNSLWTQN